MSNLSREEFENWINAGDAMSATDVKPRSVRGPSKTAPEDEADDTAMGGTESEDDEVEGRNTQQAAPGKGLKQTSPKL